MLKSACSKIPDMRSSMNTLLPALNANALLISDALDVSVFFQYYVSSMKLESSIDIGFEPASVLKLNTNCPEHSSTVESIPSFMKSLQSTDVTFALDERRIFLAVES